MAVGEEIAEKIVEKGDEQADDKVGAGFVLVDFQNDNDGVRELDGAEEDLRGREKNDGNAEKRRGRTLRKRKTTMNSAGMWRPRRARRSWMRRSLGTRPVTAKTVKKRSVSLNTAKSRSGSRSVVTKQPCPHARSPHRLFFIPPTAPWPGRRAYLGSYSLALYLATHPSTLQSRSANSFCRTGTGLSHHSLTQPRRPGSFVRSAESWKFLAAHIRTVPSTAAASLQ